MDYYINPAVLTSAFTVPSEVVDKFLRLSRAEHIKVLLYILRNMADDCSEERICSETGVSAYEVKEALLYWADCGILLPRNKPVKNDGGKAKKLIKKTDKPDRRDIARRGAEDEKIRFLLNEAQLKFGRALKSNEAGTLVWLYDDEGMDVSLILMIIQYAAAHNRLNISFIEKTAVGFAEKGIDNIADADAELNRIAANEQAWNIVRKSFGLGSRRPSAKEEKLAAKWVLEWGLSADMLKAAYDACVDGISEFSMPYVSTIIEKWHKNGYKKPQDINGADKPKQQESFAAYDIDLFEKMLNTKD